MIKAAAVTAHEEPEGPVAEEPGKQGRSRRDGSPSYSGKDQRPEQHWEGSQRGATGQNELPPRTKTTLCAKRGLLFTRGLQPVAGTRAAPRCISQRPTDIGVWFLPQLCRAQGKAGAGSGCSCTSPPSSTPQNIRTGPAGANTTLKMHHA